jgi:hypothetical protein
MQQILLMFIKWSSLQKRVILLQNTFYEIDPGLNVIKLYTAVTWMWLQQAGMTVPRKFFQYSLML